MNALRPNELKVRRLGIDTYRELVVFMRHDCAVCRAEGFRALSRVLVSHEERSVIATLNVVRGELIAQDEVGLSEAAWLALGSHEADLVRVSHPEMVESFSAVRNKIYGGPFTQQALDEVMRDITAGRYSAVEIASFVTACAGDHMSLDETLALTRAMVSTGTRLAWQQRPILDKHCVGGLPGNRTTPIIVAIIAAAGLTIPKTSSRAITSPAGTADTMEVLAPVDLTLAHMKRVVESEGGCIVWGGAMDLSPADDILIQVERPLDFDSDGQLAASILSKKLAAGSTHLVIDLPVGATAKVRSPAAALALSARLIAVGSALGLQVRAVETDGSQPVGCGIGPVLEAIDIIAVLRNQPDAPADLRERSLLLSGQMLEFGGKAVVGEGLARAAALLASGAAWKKFEAICIAQGGLREPKIASQRHPLLAPQRGTLIAIDNRRLGRLAKLAGAPASAAAGLSLQTRVGEQVERGQPLCVIHAESAGELDYARGYALAHPDIFRLVVPQ